MAKKNEKIKVVELFAGVGGFRLGLEGYEGYRRPHHRHFETIWFNQWEPSTSNQHAHKTYTARFHPNEEVDVSTGSDIASVVDQVPHHDMLVGGFPCQDYSVARNLSDAKGLVGSKGVLWWSIYNILVTKGRKAPKYLMLENVDRLLNSPANQRGRDFAIILSSLNMLGYLVEWRVINAADYGMPQRRRRIFIMGYKKGTPVYEAYKKTANPFDWIEKHGVIKDQFPATIMSRTEPFKISLEPKQVSDHFNEQNPKKTVFMNAGVAFNGNIFTAKVSPTYQGKRMTLGDIVLPHKDVPAEFFIPQDQLERWKYLKGAKKEPRIARNGHEFFYTEGPLPFPDPLNRPSRTIVTGEGGPTPSRFKHVIQTEDGRYRRLVPEELEMLCMFPKGHTDVNGNTPAKRAFFMGNALVVGVIDKLGKALAKFHNKE